MSERKQLRIDPARRLNGATPRLHQYVRALDEQGYGETVAVEELDAESLLIWVHSRSNRAFVEDCIGHLLGHGPLHFKTPLGAYPGPVPDLDRESAVPDFEARILGLLDEWIGYWRNNIAAHDETITTDGFADWLQARRDDLSK